MEKRTKIIITVVITALSMVYTLLSYFGIIRYFSIQLSAPHKYIEMYSKLDKADKDGRVVITMALDPKGLGRVKGTINSLLDQTVKVDQIAINMPPGKYDVPDWLKKVATIYRTGKDYKNLGSIIPTLIREGEKDTRIIIVENGIIYGVSFIQNLIEASDKAIGKAIYTRGKHDLIETAYGVLVKPEFFRVKDLENVNAESDVDLWITSTLKKSDIDTKKISYRENMKGFGKRRR